MLTDTTSTRFAICLRGRKFYIFCYSFFFLSLSTKLGLTPSEEFFLEENDETIDESAICITFVYYHTNWEEKVVDLIGISTGNMGAGLLKNRRERGQAKEKLIDYRHFALNSGRDIFCSQTYIFVSH